MGIIGNIAATCSTELFLLPLKNGIEFCGGPWRDTKAPHFITGNKHNRKLTLGYQILTRLILILWDV